MRAAGGTLTAVPREKSDGSNATTSSPWNTHRVAAAVDEGCVVAAPSIIATQSAMAELTSTPEIEPQGPGVLPRGGRRDANLGAILSRPRRGSFRVIGAAGVTPVSGTRSECLRVLERHRVQRAL